MKNISCAKFTQLDQNAATVLAIWLDGYISDFANDTSFSFAELDAVDNKIMDFCRKRPGEQVLEVARILLIQ